MADLPQRKSANVNVSPVGVTGGSNAGIEPPRRSAAPFSTVNAGSVLPTRSAGVTPTGVPINDKDAGNGTGNVRGVHDGADAHTVYMGGAD